MIISERAIRDYFKCPYSLLQRNVKQVKPFEKSGWHTFNTGELVKAVESGKSNKNWFVDRETVQSYNGTGWVFEADYSIYLGIERLKYNANTKQGKVYHRVPKEYKAYYHFELEETIAMALAFILEAWGIEVQNVICEFSNMDVTFEVTEAKKKKAKGVLDSINKIFQEENLYPEEKHNYCKWCDWKECLKRLVHQPILSEEIGDTGMVGI